VANSARHLLVVDDEPHIGLVLRPYLEQLGYRVSFARTLDEARSALRANPATDGLLLDLHLPDGSGLDFLRDLRAAPPVFQSWSSPPKARTEFCAKRAGSAPPS